MNYNDMMRTVAGTTALTRKQADEVVVSTLTVLSEVISADETRDLLAQLPKSIRDRVPVSAERLPMRPIEFVARVADLGTLPVDAAERNVRAVFSVLTQAVNSGEINDIAEELGDEYADLLGRAARVERAAAARSARGAPGVVDRERESVAHVVGTAIAIARIPVDVGLRRVGLRH